MSSRHRRDDRGATLIEALVALALFGISMAAIGKLLTCHVRRAGTNNTYTTAVSMGEQELEDLRSQAYSVIASRSSQVTTGGITYTITTAVVPDSPALNMKSITTTINWREPNGSQTYTLNAIYTAVTQ